jgi:2-dehydropantoate 2-reductase
MSTDSPLSTPVSIGVLGAGAIGAHVGLRLAAVGLPLTLVGRPALVAARAELEAVDLEGRATARPAPLLVTTDPRALATADVVLVAVKSGDTAEAARALVDAGVTAPVVSLQNGLFNPERLRAAGLPVVVPAMVAFNVVREGARFRQATSGPLTLGRLPREFAALEHALLAALRTAGFESDARDDIAAVVAGKLLLNLNNGIGACAGLPIRAMLHDRQLRRCFAACMAEGLAVMRAAGIRPARVLALPPEWIARLLPLPDAVVLRVARRMIAIDPAAKTSTLQDLEAGRATEVDDLHGAIVTLAARAGVPAPRNAAIVELVHELEAAARRGVAPLPHLSGAQLRARLGV